MKATNQKQLEAFREAKIIALNIGVNQFKRARLNGEATNYKGANINGKMYVIGDTEKEIQNPCIIIDGQPAREIFGDFTIMAK